MSIPAISRDSYLTIGNMFYRFDGICIAAMTAAAVVPLAFIATIPIHMGVSLTVDTDVLLMNPATNYIHSVAYKQSEKVACYIQCMLYFGKIIDRVIQAVCAPIFNVAAHLSKIRYKSYTRILITSPILIPLLIVKGLIESVGLLLNAALQAIVPYQTIYAVHRGKEGIKEYSDLRKCKLDSLKFANRHKPLIWMTQPTNDLPDLSLQSFKCLEGHSLQITQLLETHHLSSEDVSSTKNALTRRRVVWYL